MKGVHLWNNGDFTPLHSLPKHSEPILLGKRAFGSSGTGIMNSKESLAPFRIRVLLRLVSHLQPQKIGPIGPRGGSFPLLDVGSYA